LISGGSDASSFGLQVLLASHGCELEKFEGDFLGMEGQDDAFYSAYSFTSDDRAQRYNFV